MTSIARRLSLATVFGIALPIASVRAASFDCSHASTRRERTICTTSVLSNADKMLDAQYRKDVSQLDGVGATSLRDDQRAWLKTLDIVCRRQDFDERGYRTCLSNEYAEREDRLRDAVLSSGGMTIYYVDRVVLSHYNYFGPDNLYESYVVHYPQIDRPDTEETTWNRRLANVPDPNFSCRGDSRVVAMYLVDVDLLVPSLIWTKERSDKFVCTPIGTLPSFDTRFFQTVTVMRPSLHPATAEDVFLTGSDWSTFLDRALTENNGQLDNEEGCDPSGFAPGAEHDAIRDPATWHFSYRNDGIQGMYVMLPNNDRGCPTGIGFLSSGLVPWKGIAPYLRPDVAQALEARRRW